MPNSRNKPVTKNLNRKTPFFSRGKTWGLEVSQPSESNRRPTIYETVALPAELGWRFNSAMRKFDNPTIALNGTKIFKIRCSRNGALTNCQILELAHYITTTS